MKILFYIVCDGTYGYCIDLIDSYNLEGLQMCAQKLKYSMYLQAIIFFTWQ